MGPIRKYSVYLGLVMGKTSEDECMCVCVSNEDLVRILNVPVHDRETNIEMFAVENGKNLFKTHFVNWSNILNRASKYMNLKKVLCATAFIQKCL